MALNKKSDAKSPEEKAARVTGRFGAAPAFEETPDNDVDTAPQGAPDLTQALPVASDASPVTAAAASQSLPGGPDFGIDTSKILTAGTGAADKLVALDKMSIAELLELRSDIDGLLPPTSLASINLEEELVLQWLAAKALQASVMGSRVEQANYQASVMNATTNVLKQVVEMQESLHRTENVKAIEFAIERAMAGESMEVKTKFLERYKQALAEASTPKKREKVA